MSRAIGAAKSPPKPVTPLTVTATAIRGLSAGAKPMNHTSLILAPNSVSAVPVLPATWMPGICGLRAGAALHHAHHHVGHGGGRRRLHHRRTARSGSIVSTVRPSRSTTRVGQVRLHQLAAVGHRGGDLGHLQRRGLQAALADRHAPEVDEARRRRDRVARRVGRDDRRPTSSPWGSRAAACASKPKRSMYSFMVALPSFSPTWANAVLTDLASAVLRSIWPKSSLKSLASGTPEILLAAVAVDRRAAARTAPVSIAAVEVTTLNVEPGASPNCTRAVDQRLVARRPCWPRELALVGDRVGVVGRRRGHHLDRARARVQRDRRRRCWPDLRRSRPARAAGPWGPATCARRRPRAACRSSWSKVVVIAFFLPGQLVVAVALEPGLADRRRVGVADRVRRTALALRVGAVVDALVVARRARDHRAVGGADRAAPDLLRRGSGRAWLAVSWSRSSARSTVHHDVDDQQRAEHQQRDDEQAADRLVHASPPRAARGRRRAAAAPAARSWPAPTSRRRRRTAASRRSAGSAW